MRRVAVLTLVALYLGALLGGCGGGVTSETDRRDDEPYPVTIELDGRSVICITNDLADYLSCNWHNAR